MNYENLMQKAIEVSKNAYSKYSNFKVGACVLTENGNEYSGCNFENSSFGLTICAERNAIGSAIAEGETKIKAIAIYSPDRYDCIPCGACLQVMTEFAAEDFKVITKTADSVKIYKITDLFPNCFKL